jgi:hypothetical protein
VLLDRLGLGAQARDAHAMANQLRPENVDIMLRLIASQVPSPFQDSLIVAYFCFLFCFCIHNVVK